MKHTYDLNNKYRVLLTEVLPYELPLVMNNEAFYKNMLDDDLQKLFKDVLNKAVKKGEWSIPFDYHIRRSGSESSRKLSLMHPITQLDCVDLYAKYDEYMLNLCSHSPFSIRYIDKKAKCIFPPVEREGAKHEDRIGKQIGGVDDEAESRYRYYFSYKKYDLSYKFFDSGDNLRLEQKYPYMMELDVHKCFYHIYTHSIAWAVKGKEVAKETKGRETFEKAFDELMQRANYNETNGIIVGPEISRIFAEIILQAIDLDLMRQLKECYNYSLGRDYEIRRYVDDSYVYATSRKALDHILAAYKDKLGFYKLDINEDKLHYFERPFTTQLSDAKSQVNKLVSDFGNSYLKKDENGNYIRDVRKDMSAFVSFVNQFRSITHQYQQNYGALNKYTLTLLLRQIKDESMIKPSQGLLSAYAEIAFYIFSLDMHTTASYRLCSILDFLVMWSEKNPDLMVKQELLNKIRREAKRVLDIYQSNQESENTNLEVLNMLLTFSRLVGYKIPQSMIEQVFRIDCKTKDGYDKLNYFQICTLLYIIEDTEDYRALKESLEAEILLRLSEPKALRKAEMAYLFFDIITCPYVSKDTVLTVIEKCTDCEKSKAGVKRVALAKPGRWFFDWDKKHSLTDFLYKKEYHSPYE